MTWSKSKTDHHRIMQVKNQVQNNSKKNTGQPMDNTQTNHCIIALHKAIRKIHDIHVLLPKESNSLFHMMADDEGQVSYSRFMDGILAPNLIAIRGRHWAMQIRTERYQAAREIRHMIKMWEGIIIQNGILQRRTNSDTNLAPQWFHHDFIIVLYSVAWWLELTYPQDRIWYPSIQLSNILDLYPVDKCME